MGCSILLLAMMSTAPLPYESLKPFPTGGASFLAHDLVVGDLSQGRILVGLRKRRAVYEVDVASGKVVSAQLPANVLVDDPIAIDHPQELLPLEAPKGPVRHALVWTGVAGMGRVVDLTGKALLPEVRGAVDLGSSVVGLLDRSGFTPSLSWSSGAKLELGGAVHGPALEGGRLLWWEFDEGKHSLKLASRRLAATPETLGPTVTLAEVPSPGKPMNVVFQVCHHGDASLVGVTVSHGGTLEFVAVSLQGDQVRTTWRGERDALPGAMWCGPQGAAWILEHGLQSTETARVRCGEASCRLDALAALDGLRVRNELAAVVPAGPDVLLAFSSSGDLGVRRGALEALEKTPLTPLVTFAGKGGGRLVQVIPSAKGALVLFVVTRYLGKRLVDDPDVYGVLVDEKGNVKPLQLPK